MTAPRRQQLVLGPILQPLDDGTVRFIPDGAIEADKNGVITFVGALGDFGDSLHLDSLDLVELAGEHRDLVDRLAEARAVAAAQLQGRVLDVVEACCRAHRAGPIQSQISQCQKRERPRRVDTAFPLTF